MKINMYGAVWVLGFMFIVGAHSGHAQELTPEILKQADLVRSLQKVDNEIESEVEYHREVVREKRSHIFNNGELILKLKMDQKKEDRIAKRDQGASDDAVEARHQIADDRQERIEAATLEITKTQEELKKAIEDLKDAKEKLEHALSETRLSKKTLISMAKEIHNANCEKRTFLQSMGKGLLVIGDAIGDIGRSKVENDEHDVLILIKSAQCDSAVKVSNREMPVERKVNLGQNDSDKDTDSTAKAELAN